MWSEICTTLLTSRRPEQLFADLDCDLEKIKRHATKLRDAIFDPDRIGQSWPRTVPRKTGARFDYLLLYESVPAEVMKLNMQDIPLPDDAWERANEMERSEIALRLLRAWPTLSELLDELLAKITQERKKEKEREHPVKRVRKNGDKASNKEMRFTVATDQGEHGAAAIAYANLGIVLKNRGDLDGAEQMHRKSFETAERRGSLSLIMRIKSLLGGLPRQPPETTEENG